jgi:hypothetical protein
MRKIRMIAIGVMLGTTAAVLLSTPPVALAKAPCDGSPGASFFPLPGGGTFFLGDDSTGWTVYLTVAGNNDFLQLRPNGQAYLHLMDQDVALVAVHPEEGALIGTGHLAMNARLRIVILTGLFHGRVWYGSSA